MGYVRIRVRVDIFVDDENSLEESLRVLEIELMIDDDDIQPNITVKR